MSLEGKLWRIDVTATSAVRDDGVKVTRHKAGLTLLPHDIDPGAVTVPWWVIDVLTKAHNDDDG